jgi:hypothetical protein
LNPKAKPIMMPTTAAESVDILNDTNY